MGEEVPDSLPKCLHCTGWHPWCQHQTKPAGMPDADPQAGIPNANQHNWLSKARPDGTRSANRINSVQ